MNQSISSAIRSAARTLLCGFAALLAASCSTDTPDRYFYTDIATFDGQNEQGSTFTLQRDNASPAVTVTSTRTIDAKTFAPGCRLLVAIECDNAEQAYQPGPINLVDVGTVINGEIEINKSTMHTTYDLYIESAWVTGRWLNLAMAMPYKVRYKTFRIEVNENDVDEAIPDVWVIFEPDTVNETEFAYQFASIDLDPLLSGGLCKGVKLRFAGGGIPDGTVIKF